MAPARTLWEVPSGCGEKVSYRYSAGLQNTRSAVIPNRFSCEEPAFRIKRESHAASNPSSAADSAFVTGVSNGHPFLSTYSSHAPANCDVKTAATTSVV